MKKRVIPNAVPAEAVQWDGEDQGQEVQEVLGLVATVAWDAAGGMFGVPGLVQQNEKGVLLLYKAGNVWTVHPFDWLVIFTDESLAVFPDKDFGNLFIEE